MYHTPRTHWQLRLMNVSFVLLFLAAVGLLHWLSREYSLRVDLTEARRHSLSEASTAVLKTLKGPVRITAYASERGELRRLIRDTVALYQRHKTDIELAFVDPDNSPEKVRTAGVTYDGELVFEHEGSREMLPPQRLTEEQFTNLLQRLGRRGERWVVFLSGHGERSPDRQANFDLSTWARELRARGFKTREHSLAEHPQLPANTSVLVIAGPRSRLLAGELKEIDAYVRGGGNLLWLHDPGALHGLDPLAENLGIEFQAGVIVDPVSAAVTNSATAIVVTQYGGHPIVRNFGEATVFPHAAGVLAQGESAANERGKRKKAADRWTAQALLDTRAAAWSETGALDGAVRFDQGKDIRGPLSVAVALTRELAGESGGTEAARREQRAVVCGDGDFLSNTFIANGGNLALGMNAINWLSRDDAYVNVPVRTAPDRTLTLAPVAQVAIAVGFLIAIPLAFIGTGVAVWWRSGKR